MTKGGERKRAWRVGAAVGVVSYITHINNDLELFDVRVFGRYQLPDGPLLAGLLLRQRLETERRERGMGGE